LSPELWQQQHLSKQLHGMPRQSICKAAAAYHNRMMTAPLQASDSYEVAVKAQQESPIVTAMHKMKFACLKLALQERQQSEKQSPLHSNR